MPLAGCVDAQRGHHFAEEWLPILPRLFPTVSLQLPQQGLPHVFCAHQVWKTVDHPTNDHSPKERAKLWKCASSFTPSEMTPVRQGKLPAPGERELAKFPRRCGAFPVFR